MIEEELANEDDWLEEAMLACRWADAAPNIAAFDNDAAGDVADNVDWIVRELMKTNRQKKMNVSMNWNRIEVLSIVDREIPLDFHWNHFPNHRQHH